MKKGWFLVLVSLVLTSCSTDVDLYADYKDIPVVYSLIDAQSDTNYVKITKAFCGTTDNPVNANEAALVYDSSNYPVKLNAYFEELKSISNQPYKPTGRRLQLDTLTIHNKQPGTFYSPDQLLYYTTGRFNTHSGSERYRYKLCIIKPEGDTATAETSVLAGEVQMSAAAANFSSYPSDATATIVFSAAEEAVLYEFGMRFSYFEVHPGQPMVKKEISWGYGAKSLDAYEKVVGADNLYEFYYPVNIMFSILERAIGDDVVLDENHPNVIRYIGDFDVYVTASAEDFYIYYQSLQHGLSLSTEYSNINGGWGLLSSRIFVKKTIPLSIRTKYDLYEKPWGFQEQ